MSRAIKAVGKSDTKVFEKLYENLPSIILFRFTDLLSAELGIDPDHARIAMLVLLDKYQEAKEER